MQLLRELIEVGREPDSTVEALRFGEDDALALRPASTRVEGCRLEPLTRLLRVREQPRASSRDVLGIGPLLARFREGVDELADVPLPAALRLEPPAGREP